MRIIGGEKRGAAIRTPKGRDTRPTTDRVREALFNVLAHGAHAPDLAGARVLDLFAGSGALGLEALSRGAAFALFVDTDAKARAAVRDNLVRLGLQGRAKIWRRDATRMGRCAPMPAFDIAFLDPPYGQGLAERALAGLLEGGWLKPGALAVVEESARNTFNPPEALRAVDTRTYGDTALHFLVHVP
jgi:16S rRNA (guanine966-N2)-methyltransferase